MTSPTADRIRVLIVEDSDVVRMLLEQIVAADPRLDLAGSVPDGLAALEAVERLAPDVISMDIRMPRLDGFEATRRIMETRPTPIVVVSASVESADLDIAMNALRAGALSVVEKPVGLGHADYDRLAGTLCRQLVLMSSVNVVRQRRTRAAGTTRSLRTPTVPSRSPSVVGMVASTGGPGALATVLSGLGPSFLLPCLLVQHMTPSFLAGFVDWLDGVVPLPVRLAVDGEPLRDGHVYVAPAQGHLRLAAGRLQVGGDRPVEGHCPSATVLLESIALAAGARSIGVVLTGMGCDGARGLQAIRRVGGSTIAEDASTAVVHGMPAAAADAAQQVLPLPLIATRLRDLVAGAGEPDG